ncbi:MAG: hypothetical protein OSA06_00780 [Acidimicrobiales bacterium]|jgi:acyl-CoA thioesterase FadM|nr:hypothetical protein [Acidimicrobiales bacterium]
MADALKPVERWRTVVPPEWIDYNGHLTEGFYGVAFGSAGDALLEYLSFGENYRQAHGTFYTVESTIHFLHEIHQGAEIWVKGWLLGADQKRLHWYQELFVADNPEPAASQEAMLLHVVQGADDQAPKVGPMAEPVLSAAQGLAAAHAAFPRPAHIGRGIRSLQ